MSNFTPIQIPLPFEGQTIEIELSQGYLAIVDAIDGDLAISHNWFIHIDGVNAYAHANTKSINGRQGHLVMHRIIASRLFGCELSSRDIVDHRNGNGWDNRRSNLRLTTRRGNAFNKRKYKNNLSGLKGVSWDLRQKQWRADIQYERKRYFLGYFDAPEEAHRAYCEAAVKYFGEFARFA